MSHSGSKAQAMPDLQEIANLIDIFGVDSYVTDNKLRLVGHGFELELRGRVYEGSWESSWSLYDTTGG